MEDSIGKLKLVNEGVGTLVLNALQAHRISPIALWPKLEDQGFQQDVITAMYQHPSRNVCVCAEEGVTFSDPHKLKAFFYKTGILQHG